MRLVRCDRCRKEEKLTEGLGSGLPNTGWVEISEGVFCKKCYELYKKAINDFKNPPRQG